MKTQEVLSEKKQLKLLKSLPRFLNQKRKALQTAYGEETTEKVMSHAIKEYPEIVCHVRNFNTPMYDALIRLASKLAALKKGMREAGLDTEEFIRFSIEYTLASGKKIPAFVRKLGGKIYLSKPMQHYLKGVARSATANGWPTKLILGRNGDSFAMRLETRNCQMVAFFIAVGEGDIRPYCTFFDFTSAELLGLGLKQVSTIESGVCEYCFYRKGEVRWPITVKNIMRN